MTTNLFVTGGRKFSTEISLRVKPENVRLETFDPWDCVPIVAYFLTLYCISRINSTLLKLLLLG